MKIRTLALVTLAVSVIAAPAIAQANLDRESEPAEGESRLAAAPAVALGILGAASVAAGVAAAASGGDQETFSD